LGSRREETGGYCRDVLVLVLVLVLHRGAVTVSSAGPRGLFKGMTTATSGVIARFPLLLPVRNSVASYGASAATRSQSVHMACAKYRLWRWPSAGRRIGVPGASVAPKHFAPNRSDPEGRSATAHSARAQRSRADHAHHSPATGQRSHAQPPTPTAPTPRAPAPHIGGRPHGRRPPT
jgi:hypothetical protein